MRVPSDIFQRTIRVNAISGWLQDMILVFDLKIYSEVIDVIIRIRNTCTKRYLSCNAYAYNSSGVYICFNNW